MAGIQLQSCFSADHSSSHLPCGFPRQQLSRAGSRDLGKNPTKSCICWKKSWACPAKSSCLFMLWVVATVILGGRLCPACPAWAKPGSTAMEWGWGHLQHLGGWESSACLCSSCRSSPTFRNANKSSDWVQPGRRTACPSLVHGGKPCC